MPLLNAFLEAVEESSLELRGGRGIFPSVNVDVNDPYARSIGVLAVHTARRLDWCQVRVPSLTPGLRPV